MLPGQPARCGCRCEQARPPQPQVWAILGRSLLPPGPREACGRNEIKHRTTRQRAGRSSVLSCSSCTCLRSISVFNAHHNGMHNRVTQHHTVLFTNSLWFGSDPLVCIHMHVHNDIHKEGRNTMGSKTRVEKKNSLQGLWSQICQKEMQIFFVALPLIKIPQCEFS